MPINMSPCGSTLEEQLSSIMDVLAKAAVSEISQLFSEGSAALRLQISQSLKENEALRTRMKVMRSELFSLRLQTRSNASRAASRFALARANISRPRSKPLGNGLKPLLDHKAVGSSSSLTLSKREASSVAAGETPDIILIKDEEDLGGCRPAVEDCDGFGDRSMQRAATTEGLHVDAPGSSHMSSRNEELRIVSVHGQGEEGRLVVDGHDTLFTASELEALSSLSPDHSITNNSLFSFNSGPSERVPARGMQDGTGRPGRDGQAERLHRLQTALSLNHAGVAGDDRGRQPGQFPPQHNLVFPHAAAKSMDCSFCGERFTCREELILHRAGHTGERPSSCALCGKSFANKATLNIHMRIHTGEKPYVCNQCGKSFSQSCSLKIHLRTHSGEKPYVCLQCTASFNNPSNLRRHMVKHSSTRRFDTGQLLETSPETPLPAKAAAPAVVLTMRAQSKR
ncbi:unnamed protein product [Merluccius merluccius]